MEFVIKKQLQSLFHFDLLRFCSGDPECLKDAFYTDHRVDQEIIVATVPDKLMARLIEEEINQLRQRCC